MAYVADSISSFQTIGRPAKLLVVFIITVCVAVEVVLSLSDAGLFGPPRFRSTAYEYAGFWPGLLGRWQPNYAAQPYMMFMTYGWLHSGIMHLIVNMVTLWSLSGPVLNRVGIRGYILLYAFSIIGGGFGFALLSSGIQPMVGASGALFGLIGGLLAWAYVDRFSSQKKLWPIGQAAALLIGLNLLLWWVAGGQLAWQTHLGGFIIGWIAALLIDPTPRL